MKYIMPLLICITQLLAGSAVAQCNAGFTYTVADNTVSFLPIATNNGMCRRQELCFDRTVICICTELRQPSAVLALALRITKINPVYNFTDTGYHKVLN